MKLYCQYSGVNFTLPQLGTAKTSVLTVHPAFHMEKKHLFNLYNDWQEGLLEDETDNRLLFLALLNSTGLIDWNATANPSPALVQQHMPNMFYTCKWVTAVTLPAMKLPRFAVTGDTRKLDNIKHWLDVWEHIREDFEAGYRSTAEIEKQRQREELLEKLIKSDNENTSRFAGLLAQWAFDAAQVPDNIRSYWRQIITSKGINIFSIRKADIDEMVEHFEEALGEHGSIYSYTLLKHCRNLQKQVCTGLGFNVSNMDLVDIVTRSDFTIVDENDVTDTERLNVQKLINSAPAAKPVEANYPNKVAYLRAKISYDMAQRAAVNKEHNQAALEARLIADLSADEQLNLDEGI